MSQQPGSDTASARRDRVAGIARDLAVVLASPTARELADLTKAPTFGRLELPFPCVVRGEKVAAVIEIANFDRARYRLPGESGWHPYAEGQPVVFTAQQDGFLSVQAVNDFTREPVMEHSAPMRVIHPPTVNPYSFPAIDIGVLTGGDLAVIAQDLHAARLDWLDYDPTASVRAALAMGANGQRDAGAAIASVDDLVASMQSVVTTQWLGAATEVMAAPIVPLEELAQIVQESTAALYARMDVAFEEARHDLDLQMRAMNTGGAP